MRSPAAKHVGAAIPAVLAALIWLSIAPAAPGQEQADSQPALASAPSASSTAKDVTYQRDVLPFLKAHCFKCHGNGKEEAEMSFDKYTDNASVYGERLDWDIVIDKLTKREMPPEKEPRPDEGDYVAVIRSIGDILATFDCASDPKVGRVTLRRLNKTEYNNTIRDLIGVDFKPAADFPADDVGYGFDNIGDVLSTTPLLLESYLTAAEAILDEAVVVVDPPKPTLVEVNSFRTASTDTRKEIAKFLSFEAGDYKLRFRVTARVVGREPVKAVLRIDGRDAQQFEIAADAAQPVWWETTIRMAPATTRLALALVNPSSGSAPDPAARRSLTLEAIQTEGPFNPPLPELPETHKRIMKHTAGLAPRDAAREIIERFATRAYRRPVESAEVERCLALYDNAARRDQPFEACVKAALTRVLVSPNFLFRAEVDPPGVQAGDNYAINEYELASRLSYFLWNSMPDEELFSLAAAGKLRDNLDAQIKRMIDDPKSSSFIHSFGEQWLTLRKLELTSPDPHTFPDFDDSLRDAMYEESMLFFETLVREDRSILDLIDSDFTFVNERLAKMYGIPNVVGPEFVRVETPPDRGGVLTQASILMLTSDATRTSPVKRGKFVLEQILNTPPPPPPANVPPIADQPVLTGTLRQVMEKHRENPLCASCHQRMDPIGFAFENFDAIGAWRDVEASGSPIDPSGELPDGQSFQGPQGLKEILRGKRDLIASCITEKMMTYAIGRGVESYDRCAIDHVITELQEHDYKFSTLIAEIIKSDPFQRRTAAADAP